MKGVSMNVPEIRFKGFQGEWIQYRLEDIVFQAGIKNRQNKPFESYSISNELGFVPQNEQFENGGTMSNADKSMYYIISPNTFAYNPARINVGSIGYYEGKKDVIVSSLYVVFKTKEDICDNHFLVKLLKSELFKKNIEILEEGGVRLYFFYDKLIQSTVNLPVKEEQIKISNYISSISLLINVYEKQLSSLQQTKAACLQSMFPKEGETVPKVRFKGFEGEWEERKLCEISNKVIAKNSQMQYNITLTNSAEHGVMNQLDFFDHSVSNDANLSNYYVVENDDFVYNPRISVTAPVGPINRNLLGYTGVMSPLYYVFRVHDVDKDYLSCYFKTKLWHNYMYLNGNSGARFDRLSITDELFEQMPILIPSLAEQQKIGQFFQSLDKKISLETQRLEKLKQIKSACLDKMFV